MPETTSYSRTISVLQESEYLSQIRRLSEHCEHGSPSKETLHDKLVCGLRNEQIKNKCFHLLAEADLTLDRAIDIAVTMTEHQNMKRIISICFLSFFT